MAANNTLCEIAASLPAEDRAIVTALHETAMELGCKAKIAPVGKKPNDWKCEYIATRPARTLYILRITGQRFTVRAKLWHLAQYIEVLESCTEQCKTALLSASKDCGNHGGGCGPVTFTLDGKTYAKCRHYFLFASIAPQDVEGIRRLLQNEAKYSDNQ